MTKVLVTRGSLEDIADAIRTKLGVQTTYKPSQMASAIASITSAVLQSKTATPGASDQTIQPDSGYNGLSSVVVSGDSDLVAGNIKKNVQIFGVTGSYEGSGGGGGVSKTLLYELNESQGNVWINTEIAVEGIDTLAFDDVRSDEVIKSVVIDVDKIAVYQGTTDVYTGILTQTKPFNVRVYNGYLYVSYNGKGSSTNVIKVYKYDVNTGGGGGQ